MNTYIVTIKLPKTPGHNVRQKQTGACPVSPVCTDVTGEHHSFIMIAPDIESVLEANADRHITRIEEVTVEQIAGNGRHSRQAEQERNVVPT